MSDARTHLTEEEVDEVRRRLREPVPPARLSPSSDERDEVLNALIHATHAVQFEVSTARHRHLGTFALVEERMVAIEKVPGRGYAATPMQSNDLLVWLGRQLSLADTGESDGSAVVCDESQLEELDRRAASGEPLDTRSVLTSEDGDSGTIERFARAWTTKTRGGRISLVARPLNADDQPPPPIDLDWFVGGDRSLWATRVPLPGDSPSVGAVSVSSVELLAAVAWNLALLGWRGAPDLVVDNALPTPAIGN